MLTDTAGSFLICVLGAWVQVEPRLRVIPADSGSGRNPQGGTGGYGMVVECRMERPDLGAGCYSAHRIWLAERDDGTGTGTGTIYTRDYPYTWEYARAAFAALDSWKRQERSLRSASR